MAEAMTSSDRKAAFRTWVIVVLIAALFVCWGLIVFYTVGDKGPPPWHYWQVEDVPGESPFSTERSLAKDPSPQHVNE
jgi:hypothetical protein